MVSKSQRTCRLAIEHMGATYDLDARLRYSAATPLRPDQRLRVFKHYVRMYTEHYA